MKRRGLFLIMLGMLIVVVAVTLVSRGSRSTVCPATGCAYTGDVELAFPQETASVAACFGEGCTPAPVTRNADGKWLVPQSAPYLVSPVSVTSVLWTRWILQVPMLRARCRSKRNRPGAPGRARLRRAFPIQASGCALTGRSASGGPFVDGFVQGEDNALAGGQPPGGQVGHFVPGAGGAGMGRFA